jgi:hypothetical protein
MNKWWRLKKYWVSYLRQVFGQKIVKVDEIDELCRHDIHGAN